MKKALTYLGFAACSVLIVATFVTAKSYVQLVIAIILYPLLAYFALRLFPRKTRVATVVPISPSPPPVFPAYQSAPAVGEVNTSNKVEVVDIDKRTFLRLIGTAGLSFFVFSLLGRRVENYVFGKASPFVFNQDISPEEQASSLEPEGYRISEIDDGVISYYGFTNKESRWLIMREDSESNTFRYVSGEDKFSQNWANRVNLKYDYYYNLF